MSCSIVENKNQCNILQEVSGFYKTHYKKRLYLEIAKIGSDNILLLPSILFLAYSTGSSKQIISALSVADKLGYNRKMLNE